MTNTLKAGKAELKAIGISLHKISGEYKVYPKGTIGQAYFTDCLQDAVGTGKEMARAKLLTYASAAVCAMIDDARIREHAKNIVALFLMEQGKPFAEAHAEAQTQVNNSPLNLLKKIIAEGCK
jgi:hypothetical protein